MFVLYVRILNINSARVRIYLKKRFIVKIMAVVRIAGVTIPQNKRIEIALTYILGIGKSLSGTILKSTKINLNTRTKDLSEDEIKALRTVIERSEYVLEGDLTREVLSNIKRLKEIGSYRGSRHAKKLPVRGQRTKTNSRSIRGNIKRTMASGRKPSAQKT